MKTSTLLRIAAIITLIYFAGHTLGYPWTPGEAAADIAVIDAMKADHFQVIGVSRSYWDFYVGFGLVISLFQLGQAVFLLQLGSLAKTEAVRLRSIIAVFFVASVLNGVVGYIYFFAIPIVMAGLQAICLAFAFFAAGRRDHYRTR